MTKRLRDIAIGCRGKHRYPAMPDAQRAADQLARRMGKARPRVDEEVSL